MIANAIHTKWKFIVEFEDEETGAIAGTLGEAPDRDECEALVEEEMEYQRLRGYIRVTAEAVELCEQCEGEGSIPVEDGIVRSATPAAAASAFSRVSSAAAAPR